ncbi:hypothetical protein K4039_22810 [Lyngbya sp. CCAP 1446/10]|uniref:hypothetical protein n=1 Tax=Lyngbya sp. CCAP 1446/10 TaxID=439293 RepID=UPI0022388785|nr:hypothetical protein [Lyngbya sp. CCAP 1446/10]MCW6052826.1 hypothetical protein [Lyngbya sp. CCAP 1446/10]
MKAQFFDIYNLFPTQPFKFSYSIEDTSLLTLSEVVKAAAELPRHLVEYSTLPFQVKELSYPDIVGLLSSTKSWIILRHLEHIPRYKSLMNQLLNKLMGSNIQLSNQYFNPASFIFVSSPNFVTPFHIDPEHNFLFQIIGEKQVLVNDASIDPIISSSEIEDYYADECGYSLDFRSDYLSRLIPMTLRSNEGVYIPFTFPHMVFNGNDISISYSLTFRTKMSEHHRKVHLVNRALRLLGFRPRKYEVSGISDSLKYQLFPLLNLINR